MRAGGSQAAGVRERDRGGEGADDDAVRVPAEHDGGGVSGAAPRGPPEGDVDPLEGGGGGVEDRS